MSERNEGMCSCGNFFIMTLDKTPIKDIYGDVHNFDKCITNMHNFGNGCLDGYLARQGVTRLVAKGDGDE